MKFSSAFIIASLLVAISLVINCSTGKSKKTPETFKGKKPRVIVSTDIGGTDPDDFQSMIHYLMYADMFQTEGLIASPYGDGRKKHILEIIDLYEKDLPKLRKHSDFPDPGLLRSVVKQGSVKAAPGKGWDKSTEGSAWIIHKAKQQSDQPLWILVWGGLEDVAQALHDAPEIESKIRVYWIGGPNKKWSVHSYLYIAQNFPDLWMIEANSTYRGWFLDDDSKSEINNDNFYKDMVKDKGAFGTDFGNYYKGSIKMGDTPSVAYLLHGDANDPQEASWGGSFDRLPYSSYRLYNRNTSTSDTIPTYSLVEWKFDVEEPSENESPEIWMKIDGQRIDGFYEGNGTFRVRFVPKRIGDWKYTVNCTSDKLHGNTGEFVSANPWPGVEHPDNIKLNSWWSDRTEKDLYKGQYQGAKTVSRWREEYLMDWAERFVWLDE